MASEFGHWNRRHSNVQDYGPPRIYHEGCHVIWVLWIQGDEHSMWALHALTIVLVQETICLFVRTEILPVCSIPIAAGARVPVIRKLWSNSRDSSGRTCGPIHLHPPKQRHPSLAQMLDRKPLYHVQSAGFWPAGCERPKLCTLYRSTRSR